MKPRLVIDTTGETMRVGVSIEVDPAAAKKLAEHAARAGEVAELAPEIVRLGRKLFDACAGVLDAVERDANRAIGRRKKKRKLPRARPRK